MIAFKSHFRVVCLRPSCVVDVFDEAILLAGDWWRAVSCDDAVAQLHRSRDAALESDSSGLELPHFHPQPTAILSNYTSSTHV